MALCKKCWKELNPYAAYCENCGAPAEGVVYKKSHTKAIVGLSIGTVAVVMAIVFVWSVFFSGLRIGTFVDNWNRDMDNWKNEGTLSSSGYTNRMLTEISIDDAEIEKDGGEKMYSFELLRTSGGDVAKLDVSCNNQGKVKAFKLSMDVDVVIETIEECGTIGLVKVVHVKAFSAFTGEDFDYDEACEIISDLWEDCDFSYKPTEVTEKINATVYIGSQDELILEAYFE